MYNLIYYIRVYNVVSVVLYGIINLIVHGNQDVRICVCVCVGLLGVHPFTVESNCLPLLYITSINVYIFCKRHPTNTTDVSIPWCKRIAIN